MLASACMATAVGNHALHAAVVGPQQLNGVFGYLYLLVEQEDTEEKRFSTRRRMA